MRSPGPGAVHLLAYTVLLAFVSVESSVESSAAKSAFPNWHQWRLIKDWYAHGTCCVCVDGVSSRVFPIERGVRQGSVLSPTLFNIMMDPLLTSLESSDLGLCVNRLYGGAYLHPDDIRTLSTSVPWFQMAPRPFGQAINRLQHLEGQEVFLCLW